MATGNTAQDYPGSRHFNRKSVVAGVVIVVLALSGGALLLGPANSATQKRDGESSRLSLNTTAHGDSTGVEAEVLVEPYHFDHSIVNRQDLPDEPNPAPRAIAAYD